jgi:hypothetical protein
MGRGTIAGIDTTRREVADSMPKVRPRIFAEPRVTGREISTVVRNPTCAS